MAVKQPVRIRSYLEDALSEGADSGRCGGPNNIGGKSVGGGLTEFSGSYAPVDCPAGMLGGDEYYRAYRESELARAAPDVLARQVRSTWDEPFLSIITPEKPAAVSLAGYDVFGPQSFSTTTRNMSLDLRGEAAYAPNLTGEVPMGASVSSLAMGAAMNFNDCAEGCGCNRNPAGIQLPGAMRENAMRDGAMAGGCPSGGCSRGNNVDRMQRCRDHCQMIASPGSEREQCMSQCRLDQSSDPLAEAGSNEDLHQGCVTDCLAQGMDPNGQTRCVDVCGKMFKSGRVGGGKVASVHPDTIKEFTPKQIKRVTVLKPYHTSY